MDKPVGMRAYYGPGHPKYIGTQEKRYYNGITRKVYVYKNGRWVED